MSVYNQIDFSKLMIGEYRLVPIREQDIFPIMEWRNAQIDVLRQNNKLTRDDQEKYYREVILATFGQQVPSQMLFSFLLNNDCIGYGGITHIDWLSKRSELSFLLDSHRAADAEIYAREFTVFLRLMKKLVFEELQFNRLFTETYDVRPLHVSVLEKNGFVPEGRMRQHVNIQGSVHDALIHGIVKSDLFKKDSE
jgi:RimJ/RimL family protein N-acetyltransferase